jgi:hypothetical protein
MGCLSCHKGEFSLGNNNIHESLNNYTIIFQAPTFPVYVLVYMFAIGTNIGERFKGFMLVSMKVTVFWDVMLHGILDTDSTFRVDDRGTRFL